MNPKLPHQILTFQLASVCFAIVMLCSGCGEAPEVSTKVATERKELPKFNFHKPRNYALAVERVAQIHASLVADGKFPTPTSYTVARVGDSGDGDLSQDSYQLVEGSYASEARHECCDHCDHEGEDHAHGHRDPFAVEPEKHTVIVDAFTELSDIVEWLPSIASQSDLYSADMDSITSASQSMLSAMEPIAMADTEESKLETYKTKADELGTSIEKLEAMVKESGAKVLAD